VALLVARRQVQRASLAESVEQLLEVWLLHGVRVGWPVKWEAGAADRKLVKGAAE